ncbi:hypothetical protein FHX42_004818 [Saccharopolyspora lacisalsi]|uniref:Uncharacterized protein n=1 Tax=Halosaccharopolyspora lacisalsi TaxID=1000566 RepID=A0A839DZQ4_9PSEU|nr:hypothetical protein [Halosaccharopolyspora lacisalsi]MBA8827422.1 hypothetical protein [Halosaccharopolyspora lacisalsi]
MALHDDDLSFDPRDPYFPVPGGAAHGGVRWAIQVFTTTNGYGLDAASARPEARGDQVHLRCDRYASFGQQRTFAVGEVDVRVTRSGDVLEWAITVAHDEPVKSVKLLLVGLDPAVWRAGWWAPNTGRDITLGVDGHRFQLDYPGPTWATPWVAAGDDAGAVTLSIRDPLVRKHILHVSRPPYADEPITELLHVPAATSRSTSCRIPPIRLRRNASPATIDDDLDAHMSFVERTHRLVPWRSRTDKPDWLDDIALVVTMHGQHWTGYVFNTFSEMAETLRFVSRHIDPRRVLAYLPGWEGRYYFSYPDYRPGADLGGRAGFEELVATAAELGVRLMPMFGGNGVNVKQYPRWEQAAIHNRTNRYVELLNRPDWDGDRIGEGNQVFLNPGEPGFREHLIESISWMIREFGVEAAFLDTIGYWFNDPRYDLLEGYRQLAAELRRRHSRLVLASEGWWDALSGIFPLSQQWLGVSRELRKPRVLTRYARTTSHLAEGTPGPGSTGVHEQGYRPRPPLVDHAGHIPILSFADNTLRDHSEEAVAIIRWARDHAAAVSAG